MHHYIPKLLLVLLIYVVERFTHVKNISYL